MCGLVRYRGGYRFAIVLLYFRAWASGVRSIFLGAKDKDVYFTDISFIIGGPTSFFDQASLTFTLSLISDKLRLA